MSWSSASSQPMQVFSWIPRCSRSCSVHTIVFGRWRSFLLIPFRRRVDPLLDPPPIKLLPLTGDSDVEPLSSCSPATMILRPAVPPRRRSLFWLFFDVNDPPSSCSPGMVILRPRPSKYLQLVTWSPISIRRTNQIFLFWIPPDV